MSLSRFMLHDEFAAAGLLSPKRLGGSPVTLMLYVPNVDAFHEHAVAHGATALSEPEDRFWGLRSATLVDPFGHRWLIASRIEDLSPDEILRRAAEAAPGDLRPMGGRN
jgi:PhnB protein